MRVKRFAGRLAGLVLAFGILISTVLVCGGHHRGNYAVSYALCTVEGCQTAGRHVHDGVTYCGSAHECGYCDGTCVAASNAGGHHNGGHHGGHC